MTRIGRLPILFVALLLVSAGSLLIGRHPIPLSALWAAVSGANPLLHALLVHVRLPEILAAVMIGAALSVSGSTFQALFMNPLVSPSILGVLSGAAFGAALGIVLGLPWGLAQVISFGFGLLAVLVALFISRLYPVNPVLMLVLGGIISGALFTALLTMVQYLANPYTQLPTIVYWLMGNLSGVRLSELRIMAIPILLAMLALTAFGKTMNVLSMGDEEAQALGVSVHWARIWIIALAIIASALTVSLAGMIAWVGLIVPHITRFIVGPDNRVLIPASALTGGLFLVIADDISRTAFSVEIPLGVVTDLVGIIAFMLVLHRLRKGWTA
ncbi:FecCD family ABC transporter permease [Acidithiobacillus thiooxidans]|uniref:Putative ABC transporter permease protein n=1 Tax=Acidithiobacillus thiooxidans ATCC 19377 TaxID=637390 RepID=A0A543Q5V0_ACITH|nr:iron ABC transporter permease [Acidithiobacillus thiooxidans]MDX5934077.1 iron ABC transporter permease [Acidithiobacillus thiooxidans]TQN51705.1 putative ABC transporter permease protein [Acidithiobacillus thiooxidans ATCC 19377]